MTASFKYEQAFSRNLGWVSESEFEKLRNFKIAIAGMGGVGGSHLITLVRMGFSQFVICDFDEFEMPNFNRQYGASLKTIGLNKAETMADIALSINPEARIQVWRSGLSADRFTEFFQGVDLYVDGLDFFELDLRIELFKYLKSKGIPGLTAAPIGFGSSVLVFDSKSMSFEQYFGLVPNQPIENAIKFAVGLAPSMIHLKSLVDRKYSDISRGKTASTPVGCLTASSVMCTEAIKILLKRGTFRRAPFVTHYDFYLNRQKINWVFFGKYNPFQILKIAILKYIIRRLQKT